MSSLKCVVNIPEKCEFTLNNLPYGVFSTKNDGRRRIGVAVGEHVLDLSAVKHLFNGPLMKAHQVIQERLWSPRSFLN